MVSGENSLRQRLIKSSVSFHLLLIPPTITLVLFDVAPEVVPGFRWGQILTASQITCVLLCQATVAHLSFVAVVDV